MEFVNLCLLQSQVQAIRGRSPGSHPGEIGEELDGVMPSGFFDFSQPVLVGLQHRLLHVSQRIGLSRFYHKSGVKKIARQWATLASPQE